MSDREKSYIEQYNRMIRLYGKMKERCEKQYEIRDIFSQISGTESTYIGSNKPAIKYIDSDIKKYMFEYINTDAVIEESRDMIYAFFQNCYHLKDWIEADNELKSKVDFFDDRLLFNIEKKAQSDLDNGIIPDSLSQKFKDKGVSLSNDTSVSVKEPDNEWLITDGNNTYIVRKKKCGLGIYKYVLCMKVCADLCNGSKQSFIFY